MIEGHPSDRASLIAPLGRIPHRGPADLLLDGGHDAIDGIPVRLVQHRPFGFGGCERPGDGKRFRGGEGQIDIADPHLGRLKQRSIVPGTYLTPLGIMPRQNMRPLLRRKGFLLTPKPASKRRIARSASWADSASPLAFRPASILLQLLTRWLLCGIQPKNLRQRQARGTLNAAIDGTTIGALPIQQTRHLIRIQPAMWINSQPPRQHADACRAAASPWRCCDQARWRPQQ